MLRCGLVTLAPFPKGNVTTIRYSSYLASLSKSGVYTKVYIYSPTRMAKGITDITGSYMGVEYEYSSIPYINKYNILKHCYYCILGLFKSAVHIRHDKINVILMNEEQPWFVVVFYYLLSKVYRIKFIGEKTEYPSINIRNSRIREWIYSKKIRCYDGMILITRELQFYFSNFLKNKSKTFLLPITINPNIFSMCSESSKTFNYIAVVFGTHNRDGLEESIISYSKYLSMGGIWELVLVGDFRAMPNYDRLLEIILSNNLQSRIHILGKVDTSQVYSILYNASCLMTTPNYYISGGFPTKLGEYMLSGVPVVATNVGEILDYVVPDKDLFIAEPKNYEDIARKILYVQDNPIIAKTVASNALATATTKFNADSYSEPLKHFIDSV